MLFSAKNKGLILDQGEQVSLLARISGFDAPLTVEAVVEFPSSDDVAFKAALAQLVPKRKTPYLHGYCGVSPDQRFVRRATLDTKRLKEADYLSEIATTQFRIDPDVNTIGILNAFDGTAFDMSRPGGGKEVIFCGMPIADIERSQKSLLAHSLFPERLELTTLASLGAIIDYLRFSDSQKPTIVLEIGAESTQSFIVTSRGLEATRPIAVGLEAMVPVVQKELGLKDEESARKLFFSNTFDFTGMGASLCKRLLKELQSSMGFYEVQTGQSISQVVCTVLPSKLAWLEPVIATQIGVSVLQPDFSAWLVARKITFPDDAGITLDARKFGLIGLMMRFTQESHAPVAA